MKKLLLIVSILTFSFALKAQEEGSALINAYGSYNFPDKVNIDNGYFQIPSGFQWGVGLEVFAVKNKSIELKYLRESTHFPLYSDAGIPVIYSNSDKGSLNYILLGGTNYFGKNPDSKVLPYAGLEAGLGLVSRASTHWRFAWGGKVGIKIKTSSAISVNLNTFFQSVISAFGADYIPAYPGSGAAYAVPSYLAIFQFGVGAVISVDLAKTKR